jgi:uncharacterized protein (DUF58 family)
MSLISLIVALLAIALLLRIDFIYYIAYVCIGIYLISRWYTPRALHALRLSRTFNSHAFLGETVEVELHAENRSRLPLPWLEYSESIPPELRIGGPELRAIGLHGRQKRDFSYRVQAGRRGYYRLGPLRLSTGDLFGLVKSTTGYLPPDYLTVYPRIISLTTLGLPSRLPFGTIAGNQRLFEDPARPSGVRAYRSGDSQRQINWKASAHLDELLVRRLQPAISLETAILLNLHSGDYGRRDLAYHTEWAISVAASLAAHLANQRQPVGLITNGVDPLAGIGGEDEPVFDEENGRLQRRMGAGTGGQMPPPLLPRGGRAHLMKVLEQLARVESEATRPLAEWAAAACLPLSWGVTVIAITAHGSVEICQAMHQLRRGGFNPILLVVEPDLQFRETQERARQLGFRAFHVLESDGLLLWRQPRGQGAL